MVSEDADAGAVTAKIMRETRAARERAQQERAAAETQKVPYLEAMPRVEQNAGELQLAASRAGEIQVPDRPDRPPADVDVYFRRGRLGVVAVLALVLFWVWLRQRSADS